MNAAINLFNAIKSKPSNLIFTLGFSLCIFAIFSYVGTKQGYLFIIGSALGLVLFQANYGFTAGFTHIIKSQRTQQLRAQMLTLIIASLIMLPMFAMGEFNGQALSGKLTPISTAFVAGAFIFGVGMQFGNGCASGTLAYLGTGSLRMGITLVAFIVGSLIGTFHVPWWNAMPSIGKFSMIHDWGLVTAIIVNLSIAGVLWMLFLFIERKSHGNINPINNGVHNKMPGFLRNHWPLLVAAILLAALNLATLLVKGKPWGVTSGFALWGAKVFDFFGGDLSGYEYWQNTSWAKALSEPVLKHSTSVMNVGLVLGIWWAAKLSNKISVSYKASGILVFRLILGGLLLGYGARLASGCNIGAYFSGIASGSLAGWLWFAVAMVGNIVGFKLKNTVLADKNPA
ncbi:MAG: hypothetical protein COB38_04825 [Gammaproteobacteria bacterium]|nr:MAG: hypothetical protein COB38_04825 [Gammaproteobacteria bacterium]